MSLNSSKEKTMPMIMPETKMKNNAVECAVKTMQQQGMLLTTSIEQMESVFKAGGYSLKENNLHNRLQLVNALLYEHWKSGHEPKFFRAIIGKKVVYSLSHSKGFKSYKEMIPLELKEH